MYFLYLICNKLLLKVFFFALQKLFANILTVILKKIKKRKETFFSLNLLFEIKAVFDLQSVRK